MAVDRGVFTMGLDEIWRKRIDGESAEAFESLSNLEQVEKAQQHLPSMWKNLHNSIIKEKN